MERSLQGAQADIWELKRKFKAADDKTQAHYHKWLEKLKWDQEALQEEISWMKEEVAPSTSKPVMSFPQTTLRWKNQLFWLDPACWGHPPSSVEGPSPLQGTKGSEWHQDQPSEGKANILSMQEGDLEELQQAGKNAESPVEVQPEDPQGTLLAKVQQATEAEQEWWET